MEVPVRTIDNMDDLQKRVRELERKFRLFPTFRSIMADEVNGEDFSEATHEEAVAAFQSAAEPITVVLSRSQINGAAPKPSDKYTKVDSSTQTVGPCTCSPAFASKCADPSNSLSVLKSFQTMLTENYLTEEAPFDTHEVILRRKSTEEKLGLTLYNDAMFDTQEEIVVVKEVQPNSIAGRCNRIQQGDHIIKINDTYVNDMHEARSLLQTDIPEISFLIARYPDIPEDDKEHWSDEGVQYDDNEDLLSEVLESNECVSNHLTTPQVYENTKYIDSDRDFSLSRFTNTNSKDSGLGRTDDSIANSESSTLGSVMAFKHNNQSCFREYPTKEGSGRCSIDSVDSAKGASLSPISPRSFAYDVNREEKLECVSTAQSRKPQRTNNFENLNNTSNSHTPWVYRNENEYSTNQDVFCEEDSCAQCSDECSSAYNTGSHDLSLNMENYKDSIELIVSRPEYCVSSDANSDFEDNPLCYVTHDEDNVDSDGFQDATTEFTSGVCSNNSCNLKKDNNPSRRKSEGVVRPHASRRQKLTRSSSAPNPAGPGNIFRKNTFETLAEEDESAENIKQAEMTAMMRSLQTNGAKSAKNNSQKRNSNKSKSRQMTKQQSSEECGTDTTASSKMEWKVKIRSDGTRYITKRPVRERLMKEREAKVNKERCGLTTDDDAMTELKLGKHWSRDDRKRHLERAKEQRRRKEFMEKCRSDLLKNMSNKEGDIVKLSHKKMLRKKNKALLDDFITVQEILAHGNRFINDNKSHPLLNVTYI